MDTREDDEMFGPDLYASFTQHEEALVSEDAAAPIVSEPEQHVVAAGAGARIDLRLIPDAEVLELRTDTKSGRQWSVHRLSGERSELPPSGHPLVMGA